MAIFYADSGSFQNLTLNGGTLQGSASYAMTASYALNGGGGSTNTSSLLTTASVSSNTITFTKGDGSTFPITVATGSGGGGGAVFPYTGSAGISGSLLVNGTTTITGPWNSNFTNGLHFSFINNSTGSIYSLQNGTAWRRLDIEANPLILNLQSAANVGIGTSTPNAKLHVFTGDSALAASFEGISGFPLQIWTADEVLQGGYDATQGSIGIGSNRLQIKYGTISSEWADAAYHLYVGGIDLTTAYYIHYPGVYEVTVGSVTGGEAIYLDAPYNWSSGVKITLINATDESVNVNIDGSGNKYLEGTAINTGVLSPRSIVEYVSTGTDWRMMPSMKQITYTGISLGIADYYIYTKGVYQITAGSGYELHFPNTANFEGETITVLNLSESTVDLANNGYRPYDADDSAITALLASSAYQFICIGSNWRIVSKHNI